MVKNLSTMHETWLRSLGQEDPMEKGMATHSSILAWRIPWTEEPGGLQSMGSQRVRHDWVTNTQKHLTKIGADKYFLNKFQALSQHHTYWCHTKKHTPWSLKQKKPLSRFLSIFLEVLPKANTYICRERDGKRKDSFWQIIAYLENPRGEKLKSKPLLYCTASNPFNSLYLQRATCPQ